MALRPNANDWRSRSSTKTIAAFCAKWRVYGVTSLRRLRSPTGRKSRLVISRLGWVLLGTLRFLGQAKPHLEVLRALVVSGARNFEAPQGVSAVLFIQTRAG